MDTHRDRTDPYNAVLNSAVGNFWLTLVFPLSDLGHFQCEHGVPVCGARAVGIDPMYAHPACERHGGRGRCAACGRALPVEDCGCGGDETCPRERLCEVCAAHICFLLREEEFIRRLDQELGAALSEAVGEEGGTINA